jgi:hypothetical protein
MLFQDALPAINPVNNDAASQQTTRKEKVVSKEITVGEWVAIQDAGRKIDPKTAKACRRALWL